MLRTPQTIPEMKRFVCLIGLGAAIIAAASITIRAQNQTIVHACYDNLKGDLRRVSVPTSCTPAKETALSWNIQGPQGDKGDKGDPGPEGPHLRIIDSLGNKVGHYSFPDIALVYVGTLNEWVFLATNKNGFAVEVFYRYYQSLDCTGTGYVDSFRTGTAELTLRGRLAPDGNVYYESGPPASLTMMSRRSSTSPACQQLEISGNYSPSSFFNVASLNLTPPFKLVNSP